MTRPNVRFREYVVKLHDDREECIFCGHIFAKRTSTTRIRHHLSGETGKGVEPCVGNVPEEIKEAALGRNDFSHMPPSEDLASGLADQRLEDTAFLSDETKRDPFPTSSTMLVGREFEENTRHIWSWIMDDKVSTIGIYGMAGVGKTELLKHLHNELLQSKDIPHHLYWVTVSQNCSIERLQNLIAKSIGVDLSSEDDYLCRSVKSSKELRQNKKWILILDNLWDCFEPHVVGIPDSNKGCKLIVSTRSQEVCLTVANRSIRVNPLSHEESLSLFMMKLGPDIELSPEKRRIADCIVNECGGLPLGIIAMAGSMKSLRYNRQWRDALQNLKQSSVGHSNIDKVFLYFVRFCGQVPQDVQEAALVAIDGPPEKKLKTGPGSSNNEVTHPPKNLFCPGLGSYYDQLCSPSVKHDVIMDDVQSVVKEKTEPIASMLEQSNAILDKLAGDDGRIQVGVQGLEQGAEKKLICLHPEAESGMKNTCAEYIQHVDKNDSLEQTRLMESTSGRLVQPGTCASSTKLVGLAYVKNAIWSCLMDDKVSIIGIYGMGGNGKTTMLRNICNELLERQDISHSIYWVNVPQDFRIDRSQDLIAKRLDLNLPSKDDDLCGVVELAKELMMKQKWILILNDLFNSFDPQELGIPIPLNGSKFIITTRSEMVCQQMNCQNSIRVYPLSNEEAWTLFMEKLGHDRQLSLEEQQIAIDAARECDGLPLGIVTLAESLKGVDDLYKWKITLKRLKESNFWDMEDQIFKTLRLSYDCLDDSAKQCFVYCALFDESHKIERAELIESFIEEGIIREFDKGHSILDRLENVCLLERIDDGSAVKMHDLLRDMAIQILANEYSLVSSPPKNLFSQLCSASVKHDVIMDDVQRIVKEKTEPIASMLEQHNAILNKLGGDYGRIQVGVKGLEQGAEEELICLHPEAESGMEITCAEYIQHVDINDSLEQTSLMESTSGRLVQPGTSASSTKLAGQASVKKAIRSCLMDDKVSIIGIYGMGGNGKTTMLRNICNELLERQDISHSIYWVNVPQDFRIDTSQDLIAKRLDLNLSSKDDDLCRVVELEKELMMKQKWILILNDLWNSFDPQELGIPIPLNGSKFIMTTRSEMVCQQMNCQNIIRVDRLSETEALTLFMEKLGHDRQLSQEEQQIAIHAAKECDGLPLGIVTLAESLKGVDDLHKWKITLKRLEESNFWDMEDQIFKTLRLSYDCLDDSAKQCFVYCALFDESHKIERGELIESLIEEGIIKEMSRPAAFDKGHSILDSLENVCLLERIYDGKAVKMHDLLRDMAIQILDDEYSLDMV